MARETANSKRNLGGVVMGNSPPLSRSRFGRNREVLSDSFEAASRLGDGDTRETSGSSFEEIDAGMLPPASEKTAQPPLGLVAVKMQYSHKLGTVSEAYLNTLLQNLSKVYTYCIHVELYRL